MPDTKYCYSNTSTLKNRLGITDPKKLLQKEISITSVRMLELQDAPIRGKFDFEHLKRIHRHIFQDLFDWAGKTRTVNIGKGNLFCLVQNIDAYADSVFPGMLDTCMKHRHDREKFIRTLAGYYADVNALHPFREGNGRAQREFTRELCLACGYEFDLTHTGHEEMLRASILSFNTGDNTGLEAIFQTAIQPIGTREHP